MFVMYTILLKSTFGNLHKNNPAVSAIPWNTYKSHSFHKYQIEWLKFSGIPWNAWLHTLPVTYVILISEEDFTWNTYREG